MEATFTELALFAPDDFDMPEAVVLARSGMSQCEIVRRLRDDPHGVKSRKTIRSMCETFGVIPPDPHDIVLRRRAAKYVRQMTGFLPYEGFNWRFYYDPANQ